MTGEPDSQNIEVLPTGGGEGNKTRPGYVLSRFIFVRGMALIFFIAFLSLAQQVDGLFSSHGILPIADFMKAAAGHHVFWLDLETPTVFWMQSSDSFLTVCCYAGMFFALLAGFGVFCGPSLLVCWAFYLSFLTAGAEFLSFQWDILLIESGILAVVWAPWAMASPPLRKTSGGDGPPSIVVLWLIRWLLFRLMFMSGLCKLISGDEAWWHMTALSYHYETQPLPTPLAWLCNLLPMWIQQFSCLSMFGIEIVTPFLIFGNSLMRRIAFCALAGLQLLILLTGNYTFFNILTILLCCSLLDDSIWARVLPKNWQVGLQNAALKVDAPLVSFTTFKKAIILPIVALILLTNLAVFTLRTAGPALLPPPLAQLFVGVYNLHLVNGYGLFAVMTQKRIEIIVEGSNDAKSWRAYEFRFKPGDLKRSPPVVAPLQPRLDWQMWFAALGTVQENQWFVSFCRRLLEGDKHVLALLSKNPFPDKPPVYIRAESYQYHLSKPHDLFSYGNWWTRSYIGEYMPPITLSERSDIQD